MLILKQRNVNERVSIHAYSYLMLMLSTYNCAGQHEGLAGWFEPCAQCFGLCIRWVFERFVLG
jgi:hypothetical protein